MIIFLLLFLLFLLDLLVLKIAGKILFWLFGAMMTIEGLGLIFLILLLFL